MRQAAAAISAFLIAAVLGAVLLGVARRYVFGAPLSWTDELSAVLYDLADGVRALAVALSPYLPETAPRILAALRQPVELALDRVAYGKLGETEGIEPAAPLFPRVDLPTAAA